MTSFNSAPAALRTWWTSTLVILLLAMGGFAGSAQAQTGNVCGTPIAVNSFPFTHTGITSDYGNDYTLSDVPPVAPGAITNGTGTTNYMTGYEVVYTITPAVDQGVSISMTNDAGWAALWAFTGCPFTSTVGYHTSTSGATRSIPGLTLTGGTTYYIVVSNWDPPGMNYTINITQDWISADPCTGTPTAGTLPMVVPSCLGSTTTISAADAELELDLTYLWEESADGISWSAASGTNDEAEYTTPAFSTPTYYRLVVTCDNTSLSDTTNVTQTIELTTPPYMPFNGVAYVQGFEAWINTCATTDLPAANWLNTPATGVNSWRRNDQGASAGWASSAGSYSPASSAGSYSARFHSVEAPASSTGSLDLYMDLSAATGNTLLRFGYINTSGADVLDVFISTNGGASFAPLGTTYGQTTAWQENELTISSTSPTTVIRFRATSDLGTTDIGLDNVRLLTPCTGTPAAAVAAAVPTTVCTGNSVVLTATGVDALAGIAYQWEQSDDGVTGWAPVTGGSGATTTSYTTPALEAPRYYRLVQTCSYSAQLSYSNAVAVLMNNPVYAVYDNLAYAEDFEAWTSICGTTDVPNANWRVTPYSGNSSWRRNDEGSSANWTSVTLGGYTPAFSTGAHSARFHSYSAGTTVEGALDLHIDMSAATGVTRLSFDHINTSGTDILGIWTSVDGGQNFTQLGSLGLSATWTPHYFDFTSNAGTTVVRLLAKGGGTTDIGVDNFLLAPAPSCIMPLGLSATIISSSSAELTWSGSLSNPSNGYQWEARTSGAPGSGPAGLEASGSTAAGVITALAEDLVFNSTYVFYVRADCGGGDFSDWQVSPSLTLSYCTPAPSSINSLGIINVAFGTLNNPSVAEPGNYGDYTALTGGDVQQSLDAHVAITFNTGAADYGTKIWVDWNGNLAFEDAEELMYTGLSGTTNPNTLNASFNVGMHPEGSYRMRIGATNTNTGPSTACYTGTQGTFEDYTLTITPAPSCIAPTALAVDATGTTTGTLSWTASPSAPALGYELFHNTTGTAPTEADTPTQSGIMGTSFMIEDLDPEVTVHAWVRAHCATEDQSLWTGPVSFTPSVLHIGSGAVTSSNFPITSNYGYNYTQQIYLASELASLSENYITKIRFKHNATGAPLANSKDWVVYMGHTPKASFTGTTDWIPANTLAPVFSGAITVVNGQWLELSLSPGFLWDGTSNIVVAVDENTPGYDALASWAAFPAGATRGLYYRNDTDNPAPQSPPIGSGTSATIAQIQLVYGPAPDCLAPSGLNATNITPSGADLSWTASISAPADGYQWEVRTAGEGGSGATGLTASGATAAGVTTAYTAALATTTAYSLYVRSDCGGDLSPWAGPFSFSTPQTTPTPWSEPFAATGTPAGWNTAVTSSWTIGSITALGADPNSIYRNLYNNVPTAVFTTIAVGPIGAGDQLFLDHRTANWSSPYTPPVAGSGDFVVEISTDFGATYTILETVVNDGVAGWRTKSYPLAAYTGEYVTIRMTGNWTEGDYYLGFDNFKIESCSAPSNLTATNVISTTANLSWGMSASGPANGYAWEVRVSGAAGSGSTGLTASGTTAAANDTIATATGLAPTTTYNLYVRSDCGGEFSMWAGPYSFTTPCAAIATFPYTEPFTTATPTNTPPQCWSNPLVTGGEQWRFVTSTPLTGNYPSSVPDHTTGTGALAWIDASSDVLPNELISPIFDISSLTSARAGFWFLSNNTTNSVLHTITMDVWDGTAWVNMITYAGNSPEWVNLRAEVPSGIPSLTKFRIVAISDPTSTSSDYFYNDLFVDDFSVIETPSCEVPTGLAATSITATGADLSWTASTSNPGMGYQWEVRNTSDAVAANGITAAGTTAANAAGLNAQTDYGLYVRAICAEGDTSAWAGPVSFTTLCAAANLPYVENFDAVTTPAIPACMSIQTVSGNPWTTKTAVGTMTGKVANVSYTSSGSPDMESWLYTQGLQLTGGTSYRLEYKYFNNSTSFTERMSVAYGNSAEAGSMITPLADHDNIQTTTVQSNLVEFTPTTTGVYYIGFKCYSIANQNQLYLDDISVMETPSCEAPTDLAAANITATGADLSWTASTSAPANGYEWEVRDTADVVVDSGTTAANSASTTSLDPNSVYNLYVRAVCSIGNTSAFAGPETFYTGHCLTSGSNSARYVNDFRTTGGLLNITNMGSGYSPDGYGDFSTMIVADTAGGTINFEASYMGGTFHVGIWVDWNNDLDFNDDNEEVYIQNDSYVSSSNGTITVPVGTPIGDYRMRIRNAWSGDADPCGNDALGEAEDYTFSVVAPPSCFAPSALAVGNVTYNSAEVSWTDNTSGQYNYEVRSSGAPGSGTTGLALSGTVASGTPAITLSPLDNETAYIVYVQGACSGGSDLSLWASSESFVTGLVQIGDGATTNTNFPIYSCTAYNYTQQIYPAASYTGSPYITKIAFKYMSSGTTIANWNEWTVYMGNTTESDFATTTSWIPVGSLEQVFSGTVNPVAGEWMEIELDPGFLWDGTSNIVVAVDENSAGTSCTAAWASFSSVANSGMYYRTSSDVDPALPGTGTRSGTLAQIQFHNAPLPSCLAPTDLGTTALSTTGATIIWTPQSMGTGFQWEVRSAGAAGSGPAGLADSGSTTAEATADATGLTANTSYTFHVRAICAPGDTSSWSTGSFFTGYCVATGTSTTLGIVNFSTTGGVSNINNLASGISTGGYGDFSAMSVSQQPGEAISFTVKGTGTTTFHWFAWVDWNNDLDFDDPDEMVLSHTATYLNEITGTMELPVTVPAGNYRLRIRNASTGTAGACGQITNGEAEDYTLTVLPPPSCLRPGSLSTADVSATNATLNWDGSISSPVNGYQWEVRLSGAPGSGATGLVETGTTASGVTTATSTLLAQLTTYNAYVRTLCAPGDTSTWTGPVAFTTPCPSTGIPYAENFDDVTTPELPVCMGIETISGNAWRTATAPAAMGPGSVANVSYTSSGSPDMDSWLFTQGLNLTGGVSYRLSYSYYNNSTFYAERMAVAYGSSRFAASMSSTLADHSAISTTTVQHNTVDFTPSADGVYYIGFKCYSINNQNQLYLDDISVIETPACEMPTALVISDITATGAAYSWTASSSDPVGGYNWEVRTSGEAGSGTSGLADSGTTLAGITAASSASLTANTSYTLYVQSNCGGSSHSEWNESASFYTGHCIPAGTNASYYVDNFSTTGGSQNITNSGSGHSTGGYGDFSSMTVAQELGETIGFTAAFGSGTNTFGFRIWVDWNQDLDFDDPGEVVWSSSSYASSHSGSFAVPMNATGGPKRMRIGNSFTPNSGPANACLTNLSGEYEDYTILVVIPSCVQPLNLAAGPASPTQAELSWHASITPPALGYEWEVRTTGAGGSGATGLTDSDITAAGDTTATVNALMPGTTYSLYVRSLCAADDSSNWAGPLNFTMPQVTSSPWTEPFAVTSTPAGWTTTGWTIGSTRGVTGNPGNNIYKNIFGTGSSGTSFTTINVGPLGANDQLAFDHKTSNYSSPYNAPASGSGNFVVAVSTDFGATFTDLETVTNDGVAGWRTKTYPLTAYAGQYLQVRITGNWTSGDWDMGFDNLTIASCFPPEGIVVDNITTNSGALSWVDNGSAAYDYQVRTSGTEPGDATGLVLSGSAATGTPAVTLTPLNYGTDYTVYVRSACSAADTSAWSAGVDFTPGMSQIGDGATTATNFPINTCTDYNYTQQIYAAADHTGDPYITAIRFKYVSSGTTIANWNNWTVYMGNTALSSFATTTSWVPLASLQQVFSGTVEPVMGEWMEIVLSDPFIWDGTSNIVVAVDENTAGTTCTATWASFVSASNSGIYRRTSTNIDPASPGTATGRSGTLAQIQMLSMPLPDCLPPTEVAVANVTATSADLSWTASASATDYEWEVRTTGAGGSGSTGLIASGSTGGSTTATALGLSFSTHYSVYVRSQCDDDLYSSWTIPVALFTGHCIPAPSSVDGQGITNVSFGGVNNTTGAETGNYGDYSALVGSVQQGMTATVDITYSTGWTYGTKIWVDWNNDLDFDDAGELVYTGLSTSSNPTTLQATFLVGTQPMGQYRMRIGGTDTDTGPDSPCYTGTYGSFEDYTLEITAPPACLTPLDLVVTNITATSAYLGWTDNGSELYAYEVRTSGLPGSGTAGLELSGTVASGNPAILLNGLVEGFTYTAYLRGVCNGGVDLGDWSSGVSFNPSSSVQVGTGGTTTTNFPIASNWGYNYTQQLYLASEIGTLTDPITKIRFKHNATGAPLALSKDWVVYMGNTPKATFTGNTDWIPVGSMSEVFNGEIFVVNGQWMEIVLDTPFMWNGTDNIVVAVDENTPAYGSLASWASFTPGGTRGLYYRSDTNNPNPVSPPSASGNQTTIAQIQIVPEATITCAAPTDLTAAAASLTAQLSWTASSSAPANGYEWQVRTLGAPGSNPAGLVASGTTAAGVTTALVTGLSGNTTYGLYTRALCGAGDTSTWVVASFTTGLVCGDAFTDTGGPSASYSANENWTTTYCADVPGNQVRVLFSSFHTEANYDKLFIFNGPDVNAPKLASTNGNGNGNTSYGPGGWWGNLNSNLPGPFTSSNASGCLTFAFVSDGGTNYAGWEALTQCVEPNNTCANSTPVLCGNSYAGVTSGVPNNLPASACPFNGPASTGGQNWWRYEATANEAVTFSTCGNSDFDTRISVFSGADCSTLTCVAMGDDYPGCADGSSQVTFNATTGTTYWVAVHGAGGQAGNYELSVSCSASCAAPANDDCAEAQPIASSLADGTATPELYTNLCATGDAPTTCSGAMPVQGVWFSFNSGDRDHALLTLLDNGEDAQYTASTLDYALYTGTCAGMGASGSVACATDVAGTNLLEVSPNTDYLLLVYNTGGSGVAGSFGLMLEQPAQDDAAITAIVDPAAGLLCGSTMAPTVTLLNNGDNDLTSVLITYGLSGGSDYTYNWTGNLAYGQSVNVTLPTVPAVAGLAQTLTIATSLPNGMADGITANDAQTVLLDVGGEGIRVDIMTDDDPEFLSWMILDNVTFGLVASGDGYTQANTLISEQHCLSTENSNCYIFLLSDGYGDGLCCANGNGYWELRTPQGGLLLRDLFDGTVDGNTSPASMPVNPNYGFGHNICLPAGPGNIAPTECGIFNNALDNKVYANKVVGASNYQFEFSDPDAGFIRRIARPYNYVHFWDMVSTPLEPGVKYFARVRTDRDGPMQQAHFGTGCEMGLSIPQVVTCSELIQAPAYGHSCNETRTFNTNNSFIWAKPVVGATEYQFRIFNTEEGYDQTFIRSTYILQLKWNNTVAPPLINGYTYQVEINVKVNGLYSGFCASSCTITIDNSGGAAMRVMETAATGHATLWPNPVRDGQVNLSLDGLAGVEQTILVDIQDIYGKQVFAQEYGNSGARFTTVLSLPSDVASGVYLVNLTVNGERTTQRLSVIR